MGINEILDYNGDTMQRRARTGTGSFRVQSSGSLQGPGIQADDGVQAGTLLVIGLDSFEAHLDQFFRSQCTGLESSVDISDGRRFQVESGGMGNSANAYERGRKNEYRPNPDYA